MVRLGVLRGELPCTGRALGQLPFVAVQGLQEAVVPLCRGGRPDHLEAAGDRVLADAGSEGTLPAEALHFEGAALGFGTDEVAVARAVGLADSVPSDDERRRLLVVHRHPTERLADVLGGSHADPVGLRGPQGSRRSDPWSSRRTDSRGPDRRNSVDRCRATPPLRRRESPRVPRCLRARSRSRTSSIPWIRRRSYPRR